MSLGALDGVEDGGEFFGELGGTIELALDPLLAFALRKLFEVPFGAQELGVSE